MEEYYTVYTLKTSRGGRPKTFTFISDLLVAIRQDLIIKRDGKGTGRLIIEVKKK